MGRLRIAECGITRLPTPHSALANASAAGYERVERTPTAPRPAMPSEPRRRMIFWIVLSVVIVLSPLVVMALFVDDWSRDLSTNRAHTGPGQKDPSWELPGVSVEQIADAAIRLGEQHDAWRLADERPLPDDSPLPGVIGADPAATHHFVRSTGLMKFKDDVWLLVTPIDGGVRLDAESRSRVGKGDLGQNPRNLAELRSYLSSVLGD